MISDTVYIWEKGFSVHDYVNLPERLARCTLLQMRVDGAWGSGVPGKCFLSFLFFNKSIHLFGFELKYRGNGMSFAHSLFITFNSYEPVGSATEGGQDILQLPTWTQRRSVCLESSAHLHCQSQNFLSVVSGESALADGHSQPAKTTRSISFTKYQILITCWIICLCELSSNWDILMKLDITTASLGDDDSMRALIILLKAPWMPICMQSLTTL